VDSYSDGIEKKLKWTWLNSLIIGVLDEHSWIKFDEFSRRNEDHP